MSTGPNSCLLSPHHTHRTRTQGGSSLPWILALGGGGAGIYFAKEAGYFDGIFGGASTPKIPSTKVVPLRATWIPLALLSGLTGQDWLVASPRTMLLPTCITVSMFPQPTTVAQQFHVVTFVTQYSTLLGHLRRSISRGLCHVSCFSENTPSFKPVVVPQCNADCAGTCRHRPSPTMAR